MITRIKFLLHYLAEYKYSYFLGIIFIILTNWISVTIPEYLKRCIDLLNGDIQLLDQSRSLLSEYLIIMLVLAISVIFVRSLSRIFFFNPGRAIEYRVKNDIFKKLTLLQKDYYDKNPTGSIISRIQNDINGVRMICGFGTMQIFNIITALSFTPYKMWLLSPNLTVYIVIPVVLVFVVLRFGMHFLIKNTKARMFDLQTISSYIVSSLSGIDVIKGYNLFSWNLKQFDKQNRKLQNISIRISFFRSFLMPLLQNLENILKVVILSVGGYYVINQGFTIGELTAFIAYSALLSMPIRGLGWLTTILETGMVGVASVETILNQEVPSSKIKALPNDQSSGLFNKGIEVKNLTYTYPGQDQPVLKNVSFKILPDQTIGILGKIGSGKTTLVNCLNKYLEIEEGQIFLSGTDITKIPHPDLRSVIRTVSQDAFLFSDSIEKNIIFGADDEESVPRTKLDSVVYESALRSDIDRFPEKIETIVGEKGIMLSGGQKQRIALARAMMVPFDVLVLDNILSAVDHETEHFLLSNILKRKTSRSLLIVSNRVQALERADTVIVLDNGTLSESGTHTELINRPGLYQETWKLQKQTND